MLCHFFLPFLMRICAGQLLMNGLRSLQTFISITLLAEETDKKKLYHKSPVNIEPTSFLIFLWIIAKEKVISEIDDGEEQKYFILFCDKCWKCIQLFKFRGKLHRKKSPIVKSKMFYFSKKIWLYLYSWNKYTGRNISITS